MNWRVACKSKYRINTNLSYSLLTQSVSFQMIQICVYGSGAYGTHKWDGPTGIHKWLRILKKGGLSITVRWISKYSRVILVRSATWTRMC